MFDEVVQMVLCGWCCVDGDVFMRLRWWCGVADVVYVVCVDDVVFDDVV